MLSPKLQKKLYQISVDNYKKPGSCFKHFTFVLIRNKILTIGYNYAFKTSPNGNRWGYRFSAIHSEMDAIRQLISLKHTNFHKYRLVNVRLNVKKELAMSKPCARCAGLLDFFGFRQIYFSTDSGCFEYIVESRVP